MEAEIKVQLITGDRLSYIGINEFITLISSKLNSSNQIIPSSYQNEENHFMKTLEVAQLLNISKPTINSWVEKGVLRRIKIQSRVYFDRKEVMSLLDKKKA